MGDILDQIKWVLFQQSKNKIADAFVAICRQNNVIVINGVIADEYDELALEQDIRKGKTMITSPAKDVSVNGKRYIFIETN